MDKNRILIVDDVQKNIQVLASTLSELYDIEYTTNGYDAIDWVKSEHFDLILLDIMMPEIDGFQVCEQIRGDKKLNDLPIIFLTAKTDNESIVKGFQLGGQDYILKPFNSEELKARINTHLELKKSKEKLKDVNKWLEEQIKLKTKDLNKAYRELELLDIAKDEFLLLMSHELRTPLNGIKGFTQLLKQKIDSDDLTNYIDKIDHSSDRLMKFSQIAMLISSIRTNKHKFKFETIELLSLLNEIQADLKKELDKKSLTIEINASFDKINLNADITLFKEALLQIIENAINYSTENSLITINITGDENNMTIIFKDSGPGFSPDALKNIFQPFGLGQEHIDKEVGLGLHLVKLIMDTHKASINAGNNKEGGAFVGIVFPKQQ